MCSSSSSGVLTRPRQKMRTSAIVVVIFWSSYETKAKNNDERTLSSSSVFFLGLLKMMMSQDKPRCRLLVFFLLSCSNIFGVVFLEFALRHLIQGSIPPGSQPVNDCCNPTFGRVWGWHSHSRNGDLGVL